MPAAAHSVTSHRIADPAGFVEACARCIVEDCRARLPDLSDLLVVLPSLQPAPDLRRALAGAAGRALLLPRIVTLEQLAGGGGEPASRRQLALYGLLRERGWFADGALWEVCAELVTLFDELAGRALGLPAQAADLLHRLERAYETRGAQPLRFEAEVVHTLWRAEAAGPPGGPAALARALAAVAAQAAAPLYLLAARALQPLEQAFCEAWAARQPVTVFLPWREGADDAVVQALNFAWPPAEDGRPLLARAAAARAALPVSPLAGRLRLIGTAGLEQEAAVVTAEVKRWLAAGRRRIALVAADRVAARRARALLERDGILVQDETGWKLSTTRAAALVDAWLEVCAADAYHRDLLDLVKSPFVLCDLTAHQRQAALLQLEEGLVRHNLVCGLERCRETLARQEGCEEAAAVLERLAAARRLMPRTAATPAAWLDALEAAFAVLGALPALAGDEAGATLLGLLRRRREELAAVPLRLTFGEWREWLNRELERAHFIDRGIDSPIVMTHLAATRLRRFEAALVIGADRDGLAPDIPRAVFGSQAVRAELGLPLATEAAAQLREDLAALIAASGEVTVTWQRLREDEPNLLCAELGLLDVLHACAWGENLVVDAPAAQTAVAAGGGTAMPAPAAQRVPLRLSAGDYASLMACPYQFHARRLLGLAAAEEVREALAKRDFGALVHRVLQRFHRRRPQLCGSADEELAAELEAVSREVFAAEIAHNFLAHAWLARWLRRIPGYLAWQKAREAAGWRLVDTELAREAVLPLPDGGRLTLSGRLDRLERRADGAEAVLDYKMQDAQGVRRRLKDPGEDVQLACYVLLQGERVEEAAYVGLDEDRPALAALPAVQDAARGQAARLVALVAALRAGARLPAHGSGADCLYCEMRGLCRKDYHTPCRPQESA